MKLKLLEKLIKKDKTKGKDHLEQEIYVIVHPAEIKNIIRAY